MIEVQGISKSFGKFKALSDVTVDFGRGRCVALIGPNGSGKTTLIKTILGMVVCDSGSLKVMGKEVGRDWLYRKHIGYMPQNARYPEHMRVDHLIAMMRDIRRAEAEDHDLMEAFRISEIGQKRMGNLSGGMKQKVNAALAFLFQPEALILDEPTAGLDPLAAEILKEKIRKENGKGKLVVITSHILSDLDDLVTDITYIQDGQILFSKEIETLKSDTGEQTLSRAIAYIMKK